MKSLKDADAKHESDLNGIHAKTDEHDQSLKSLKDADAKHENDLKSLHDKHTEHDGKLKSHDG